jgi:glycosyltransferase involved in cell wall biosynthesis
MLLKTLNVKMKILHVITTIERGGAENQLNLLAQLQATHGHSVHVMYLKGRDDLANSFKLNKVITSTILTNRNFIFQIMKLKRYLIKNEFDVIHAHLPQAEMVVRFASNSKNKVIITRHFGGNFHPKLPVRISSLLGRIASKKADSVIAISESVRKVLIKNNETHNPKIIKVVYYGFSEQEFFKNSIGEQVNFKEAKSEVLKVGCISRLSKEKDLETLLAAFQKLKGENNDVHLYIAGEGSEKKSLVELSINLEIENHVTFLGKISNIVSFLQNIDLLVLTSRFEGFGMVLLEAMSTHTRIVAAMNSGIEEVVGNSGAGIFFETSNYLDLSSKILISSTIKDPAYVLEQNIQLNKFSSEKMFEQIEKIYMA